MQYRNEREVAKKAEQMLTASLRAKTSGFANHVRGANDKSIKDAVAVARVKRYGRGRGNIKQYMTTLSIRMVKHGFIQHYGVDGSRTGGSRTRSHPKNTTYNFSAHYFNMKPTPFINAAIRQSHVINFVMDNILQLRGQELIFEIRDMLERT